VKLTKHNDFDGDEWGEINDRQAEFLFAYQELACLKLAAKQVGIRQRQHNRWLLDSPAYAKEFAIARKVALQNLEAEAIRRAMHGVRKFKFHKGELIKIQAHDDRGRPIFYRDGTPVMIPYVEHQYSDNLLMFLMKGLAPETYRDNGTTINVGTNSSTQPVNPEEIRATVAAMQKNPEYVDYLRRNAISSGAAQGEQN
jgi:hypothetical protein